MMKLTKYHIDLMLFTIVITAALIVIYTMTKNNNKDNLFYLNHSSNKLNNSKNAINKKINKILEKSVHFVVDTNNANNLDIKRKN